MSALAADPRSIPFTRVTICPEARAAVDRVLSSGWVTTGPEVAAFESEFRTFVGAEHAVAVASCTAAIEIGLRSLRLPPGSAVLTSALTFCGVAHAITRAGHRPVLVDVDPVTMTPTAATTARASRAVGGADAMVVLHFAGCPSPVEELADAAGLPLGRVVEDAAHGPGMTVGDRPVGSISAATCFSFYATKNLPIGEGGMLTTDDPEVAAFARTARLHGMSRDAWRRYLPGAPWRYEVDAEGLKANMTDVQAAIGRAQLTALDGWQARRRALADRYRKVLEGVHGISPPGDAEHGEHAWHLFVTRVEPHHRLTRDQLMEELSERGVHCSVHFIPLHHLGFFRRLESCPPRLDGVDALFPKLLSLPLYPALEDDDVDRVCEVLEALGRPASRPRLAGEREGRA
jgi:dTDP-4-amino-4,6-dideoxygalactose transaminase